MSGYAPVGDGIESQEETQDLMRPFEGRPMKGARRCPGWLKAVVFVTVLGLLAGGGFAVYKIAFDKPDKNTPQDMSGSIQVAGVPRTCGARRVAGNSSSGSQVASSMTSPGDAVYPVVERRLLVKFGDSFDPFLTKARQLFESQSGRRLLVDEHVPANMTTKIWRDSKPRNGWFNSTSLMPEGVPDQIKNLVERFYYSVHTGIYALEVESGRVRAVVMRLLQGLSDLKPGIIEYVEEDVLVTLQRQAPTGPQGPNDRFLLDQFSLKRVDVLETFPHRPSAWRITQGDPEVVVGVIDTGIDLKHPDLVDRLWINPGEIPGNGKDDDGNGYVDDVHGVNFVGNNEETSLPPQDDQGHGTHVAGIIAATSNNGLGIAGVAPKVKLMALKALDARGKGDLVDIIQAIEYSLLMRVPVTCNSYGFSTKGLSKSNTKAITQIVRKASEEGQLFVAATGNEHVNIDSQPVFPASIQADTVVSVAATDVNDCLAPFSNYGKKNADLAAPGVDILSTCLVKDSPGAAGFCRMSGTSMATPIVAGTGALMMSALKQYDANWATKGQLVKEILLETVDPLEPYKDWLATGGRLNAGKAVEMIVKNWEKHDQEP